MEDEKKDHVILTPRMESAVAGAARKYPMKQHWKCLAACTLMSLCPFQYGLDFGLIGGFQAMVGFLRIFGYYDANVPGGWNLSTERQQLISSLLTLGAFLSSSMAGPVAGVMSRKTTVWTASVLCIVSNIIMMATTNIGALYAGRLLLGIANGMFMTFSQLYIQECSPARYRGLMISSFQVWTTVGTLVGTVVDNFTAKIDGRDAYMIPLGLIYIVPIVLSLGLLFVPESPRWLAQHGHLDKARKALRWHRPGSDIEVDQEMRNIQAALESDMAREKSVTFWDMFRHPVDRRRTILATGALALQGSSGAMYMIAFGTYFFQMAGIGNPFGNSCILIAAGVVAILVNSALVTHFGRRRVFLVPGLILCGIAQLLTAVVYQVNPGAKSTGQAVVALAIIYILGYNAMVAPYAWISGGELPSQRLRSFTFGFATAVGFLLAWLTTFTAPYFINPESLNWGPKYGYIWAPSCWISALWVFFFLPEVKDRTLEEIDEMFDARLHARQFRKYVCHGRNGESNDASSELEDKNDPEAMHKEVVRT
ncbi:general substrate transporter [Chaetomium fimeti]|uniref:General substrate transporter n=1 Tax=Chaetomium fimeti TaxID=1854472 RepID=A0AAE0H711_9PEZI|nr:general substrate transporter [Chaetomium fimeti]